MQKRAHSSPHAALETKNSRNVEIGTNIAHDVSMAPELFILKLCTAVIFNCGKHLAPNRQTVKEHPFLFLSHGGATYTH